jgi:hypothetical protein
VLEETLTSMESSSKSHEDLWMDRCQRRDLWSDGTASRVGSCASTMTSSRVSGMAGSRYSNPAAASFDTLPRIDFDEAEQELSWP